MGERATASDPFQSTDAECVRLPEENARLRQLLMEHNIPIRPTEPVVKPCTKRVVQVYDYADDRVPMLERMFVRRLKSYSAIGYAIDHEPDSRLRERP